MKQKTKNNSFTAHITTAHKIFFVATLMMLLFLIVGQYIYPDERDERETHCRIFEASWQQVLEDGSRVDVQIPGTVPSQRNEPVTLATTVPQGVHSGEFIFFRPIWQDVNIYIDGQLRVSYNTENSRPFGTNSAFRYVFVELTEADAGKELLYEFSSDSKYTGVMRKCYIGDELSIWLHLIEESGGRTIIAMFLFFMSLFCILVCEILKLVYKKTLPLHYLAWSIFLCALWTLSESEFRQLVMRNTSVLTSCTYWSLMIIPLPIILYVNLIQENRYQKIYMFPIFYSSTILVLGTVLQLLDIVQFVQQLPFIHAELVISMVCIIATITYDIFFKKVYDYLAVGIGVYGMLATAILEMVLYYLHINLTLGTILIVGLVFLLIMAIIKTGQDLVLSERNKQQAISAREAQAKFLANMSHEIRTPINAVIGMNEMILRENKDEAIEEYANNIQSASNMLLGLVNDILDFSKIESGQLELVEDTYSLAQLIKDEMLMLEMRAVGKPISINLEANPYIPSKFMGDELRIKQIITNLLSNAVKYTQEGSVTLKVFFEWIDAEHIKLSFSVTDTGRGIKEEDLAELFDSFKRLELSKNRNIEGTGLGLNIAKQLVDLMQGTIDVDSEYGKGSTFTVSIPQKIMDKKPIGDMNALVTKKENREQSSEGIFTAPNAKILIVDDNSMNLVVMKSLLKRTEMSVDTAKSGKECLEITKHTKYHIILMDHMMPELDGVETLHILREDMSNPNQNTVVIALTANAIAGCREEYLAYGFNDYIAKPIEAQKLDEMLIQHLPEKIVNHIGQDDVLTIDHKVGMAYAFDSEEMYHDVLVAFCDQVREYMPLIEAHYVNHDWKGYANVAHALKGNTLNIGASNCSKLSLQHEQAAKAEDEEFLMTEYARYVEILQQLVEKVESMLQNI